MRTKKAIKNIFFSLILQFATLICGFITPILFINKYGSNVYGLMSSITQFLAYIALLESGFGPVLKAALYKPIAKKNKEELQSLLYTSEKFFRKISYIFILYIMILAFVFPTFINTQFDWIFTFSLIIIISLSTFFEYFSGITYRLYLQASQDTYVISIIQLVTLIINTIAVIVLIKLGFNVQIVKLVTALIYISRPLIQNLYVKKVKKLVIDKNSKKVNIKNKWDGLSQHIASIIHSNTDIVVLTIFAKNIVEVSVYSVYYLVINGLKQLIKSFTNTIDASFGDMIAKNEYETLSKSFNLYEIAYFMITTIVYSSTFILIVPFVSIYTKGVTDADYIRYGFASILVIGEFIWTIRQPYNELIKAAGHFKETMIGAWVEAISNIIISIILVYKYGLIGVAIGTLISISIRTVEFIYHSSKYILNRSLYDSFKKIFIISLEFLLIIIISRYLPLIEYNNYLDWIINSLMVITVASIVTIILNVIFYKKELIEIFKKLKPRKVRS